MMKMKLESDIYQIVQDPVIETKGMFFNEDKVKEFRFLATKEQQKIVGPSFNTL